MQVPSYPIRSERANHPLIPAITRTRVGQFFGHIYASQHVARLRDLERMRGPPHVTMKCWSAGMAKPTFLEGKTALEAEGVPIQVGHTFGPSWSNHWVQVDLTVPTDRGEVIFDFDCSAEALLFSAEGRALHGLTGTADHLGDDQDFRRTEHVIPRDAVEAGHYRLYIEVSCNGLFGAGFNGQTLSAPDMTTEFPLLFADIVLPNPEVRGMEVDFRILCQISESTENKASDLPRRALKAANEMMNAWRSDTRPVKECRAIAWQVLGPLDEEDLKRLRVVESGPTEIWSIGHCHIDTAWLWRYTQTQQKVARSWTTQCDLMDRWPNHQFAASSAQQYLWLEELYPDAFQRVKEYVVKNRFHPVGGAWLEHDSNLPSGESLVRQYLYGQRYFKSRFGEYCREAWLPDTFGYASQLPQILRQAGLQYFFTQKLSWNNINVFPYTTFNWVGLDGSQVLAHLAPSDTYNAQCNFSELEMGLWNHKNIADGPQSLMLFGNGDGGGGPTPGHLEKLERLCSVSKHNRDVPQVKIGKPVDFFDELLRITRGGATLPTWRGELYLEFHRGTYTTQAEIKKGNKTMERLLHDLEYFATLAHLSGTYTYPRSQLRDMWQDTLLNQFHDVLPGSTISLVADDAKDIYRRRIQEAEVLIEEALGALYPQSTPRGDTCFVVDPLGLRSEHESALEVVARDGVLESDDLKLVISDGRISSLYAKGAHRELLLSGPGATSGGLTLYEDVPLEFDAWDVEIYHLQSYTELVFDEVSAVEQTIRATTHFGKSRATLQFSLEGSYVRIDAHVDWHEEHKCLKFVLPLDIHAPNATYGTQFGMIQRPTHRNTSQDWAKFEVCGHMFGDLSEAGYGVALVSPWKYGYAVEGNVMRLSLLRAPTSPDPTADRGEHVFSLAIMPHEGGIHDGVYEKARQFCNPVYLRSGPRAIVPTFTIRDVKYGHIELGTVKLAEDSDRIILRMNEAYGGRSRGRLAISGLAPKSASWVNILEEQPEMAAIYEENGTYFVDLDFGVFELKTLCLEV